MASNVYPSSSHEDSNSTPLVESSFRPNGDARANMAQVSVFNSQSQRAYWRFISLGNDNDRARQTQIFGAEVAKSR